MCNILLLLPQINADSQATHLKNVFTSLKFIFYHGRNLRHKTDFKVVKAHFNRNLL